MSSGSVPSATYKMQNIFLVSSERYANMLLGNQTDWTLESESNESVNFKERLGTVGPGLDELSRGGVPSAT